VRSAAAVGLPLLALYLVWQLPEGVNARAAFLQYELTPLATDKLSRLFGIVFATMLVAGSLIRKAGSSSRPPSSTRAPRWVSYSPAISLRSSFSGS
jgi:hypothetical protein